MTVQTDEFGRSRRSDSYDDQRTTLPRRPRLDSDGSDGRRRSNTQRTLTSPTRNTTAQYSRDRDRDRPPYRELQQQQQQRNLVPDPMTLDYMVDWKTYAAWLRSKKELSERPANREDDEAQYQVILTRYDVYKTQWTRDFQRKFFLAHQHEDWAKEKYHPHFAERRIHNLKQMKLALFQNFALDLQNGKYDSIDLDSVPTDEPTGNEPEIADRADQALRTLYIKTIPLHIYRSELQDVFTKMTGFKYLSLSDPRFSAHNVPDRYGQFSYSNVRPQFALGQRAGWVVFDTVQNAEDALELVKKAQDLIMSNKSQSNMDTDVEMSIPGVSEKFMVLQNLTINITPAGIPKFRITISEAFTHPTRILIDLEQVKQIAARLDVMYDLKGVAMLAERYPTATEKECLDKLVHYLRKVHLYCYYSAGMEAESMEELTWKCGDCVYRKPGDCDLSTDRMVGFLNKFDAKIKMKFEPPADDPEALEPLGALSSEQAADAVLKKHVQREDEHRFRCIVNQCEKLFKDTMFVLKHIRNKHADTIKDDLENTLLQNAYLNAYLIDPHHLLPRDPSGNQGTMGHFSVTAPLRLPGTSTSFGPLYGYGQYMNGRHTNVGSRQSERYSLTLNQGFAAVGMHDERNQQFVRSPREFLPSLPVMDARSMDPRGIKYYTDLDAPAESDVVLDYD